MSDGTIVLVIGFLLQLLALLTAAVKVTASISRFQASFEEKFKGVDKDLSQSRTDVAVINSQLKILPELTLRMDGLLKGHTETSAKLEKLNEWERRLHDVERDQKSASDQIGKMQVKQHEINGALNKIILAEDFKLRQSKGTA